MVPVQVFARMVKVRRPDGSVGSGVFVRQGGTDFFLTAAHVVGDHSIEEMTLFSGGVVVDTSGWSKIALDKAGDVAVVRVRPGALRHLEHLTLIPSPDGAVIGQDVYFLGFPFMGTYSTSAEQSLIGEMAFVKKAILSSSQIRTGKQVWFLDGHNNVGFSGGPVVFQRQGTSQWQVLGLIVAAMYEDEAQVFIGKNREDRIRVLAGSGIIEVASIDTALALM